MQVRKDLRAHKGIRTMRRTPWCLNEVQVRKDLREGTYFTPIYQGECTGPRALLFDTPVNGCGGAVIGGAEVRDLRK